MKKIAHIILAIHFILGAIILPWSNFDLLIQIPDLYDNCKATEDADMTPFDFITDHLINIDCIFDSHLNGDHQKPHKPFNFHFQNNNLQLFSQNTFIKIANYITDEIQIDCPISKNYYQSPFLSSVFHPPAI